MPVGAGTTYYLNLRLDSTQVPGSSQIAWPGPIFEGGGELQLIIDDRASAEGSRSAW